MEERLRRTMMFVPGTTPEWLRMLVFTVRTPLCSTWKTLFPCRKKDAARMLVYEALQTQDYGDSELVVRVNGIDTPYFKNDVYAMVKAGIEVVRLPKVESAQMMLDLVKVVEEAEKEVWPRTWFNPRHGRH